jgi:hypothetical protein
MCPACLSTLALIAAGAASTGGLTALVVQKLRGTHVSQPTEPQAEAPEREGSRR